MNRRGRLVVVSAPSGTGKSTVCGLLRQRRPEVAVSISYTTRPPRGHERNGVEYHFVDEAAFDDMVAAGQFLEWARVHDHRYGTARRDVERLLEQGRDVLFDIDIQGGLQIRRQVPEALLIFLLPPSLQELLRRLQGRATESPAQIRRRLETAVAELEQCRHYQWLVVNDDLEGAVDQVDEIRLGRAVAGERPTELVERLRRDIENRLRSW